MAQNIELKQKLEEELETLKKELATVGRINPENPKDWEPTAGVEAEHEHEPDPNDKADELEEYETNTAILKELEIRFNEVKDALRSEPTAGVEAEHEHEPDPNDKADELEEYETNTAILKELEIRFNEVKDALKRIEEGNYGVCSICGKAIESARLEANPAATTCVEHTARAK